ncbi:MAG: DNA alkylation repair protein [Ruminococcus sp.]|nr:DNA alkylation repair protein [Ruminococcus sp.]
MGNINVFNINKKEDVLTYLSENSDESYRDFTAKLIPGIDKELILGVRTPKLRELAKKLGKTDTAHDYLSTLPHRYLEENHLHAFLIEQEKDFDKALMLTKEFLPYIDNWATCDCFRPKVFRKNPEPLYDNIKKWLKSEHTYTLRYAIGLLNSFYLDDKFLCEHLELVSKIHSDEYYINMMIAWYFATALSKQYQSALPYLEKKVLPKWVHNKTIQKACESYRVETSHKAYLRTLK